MKISAKVIEEDENTLEQFQKNDGGVYEKLDAGAKRSLEQLPHWWILVENKYEMHKNPNWRRPE